MASNNDINLRYDVDRSKFSMLNFGSKTRFRCLTLSKRSTLQICQQMSTVSLRQSHAIVLSSVLSSGASLPRDLLPICLVETSNGSHIHVCFLWRRFFHWVVSVSSRKIDLRPPENRAKHATVSKYRLALVFVQRLFLCDLQYFCTASTKQLFSAYFLFNRSFSWFPSNIALHILS